MIVLEAPIHSAIYVFIIDDTNACEFLATSTFAFIHLTPESEFENTYVLSDT